MKTAKIAIALTVLVGLIAITIGFSFAHYNDLPFVNTRSAVPTGVDEDWWTTMRDYMKARWNGIEDEEWFDEMTQYMEEHWNEVQNQEWFDEMLEYMQQHNYRYNYRYGEYSENFYGPRGYGGRGRGCMGW